MAEPLFPVQDEATAGGMLKQFLIGVTNSALLDFPLFIVGEEKRKALESQAQAERIARGVGTATGFLVGLPGKVIQKGAQVGGKVALRTALKAGAKKSTAKLVKSAGAGAAGFGALELATAPSEGETYENKLLAVPIATAIGGTLGLAEPLIMPIIKKNVSGFANAVKNKDGYKFIKKGKDNLVNDLINLKETADKQFTFHLQEGKIKEANDFLVRNFVGARKQFAKSQLQFAQMQDIKQNPKIVKLFKNDLYQAWAKTNMHKLVPENYAQKSLDAFANMRRAALENVAISSAGVHMERQGKFGKLLSKIGMSARDIGERNAGTGTALITNTIGNLTNNELRQLTRIYHNGIIPQGTSKNVLTAVKELTNYTDDVAKRWNNAGMPKQLADGSISRTPNKYIKNPALQVAENNLSDVSRQIANITQQMQQTTDKGQISKLKSRLASLIPKQKILNEQMLEARTFEPIPAPFVPRGGDGKPFMPRMNISPESDKRIITETVEAAIKRGEFGKPSAQARKDAWKAWGEYQELMSKGSAKMDGSYSKWLQSHNKVAPEQAKKMLLDFQNHFAKKSFGNLEYSRGNVSPFWDPDVKRALNRYSYGAELRMADVRAWGQGDEKLLKLLDGMAKDPTGPYDIKSAEELIKTMRGGDSMKNAFKIISPSQQAAVKSFEVITKLGLAVIPNSTQSVNTAIFTNYRDTFSAIGKLLNKKTRAEAVQFAQQTGATLEGTMNDYIRGLGLDGSLKLPFLPRMSASQFLKKTGFTAMEQINRTIAANAGRSYAIRMSSRFVESGGTDALAKRALVRMNLSPSRVLKNKGLMPIDIGKASQTVVNKTQFRAGPLDLPLWFQGPEGKIVTQFKTFAFNQTKFMKNMLRDEVAKGNLRPIITAVTAMPILGEGVKDVRGILTGTKRDEKGMNRILDNIAAVGSLGLLTDIWQSATYNNVEGTLLGPAGSDIARFIEGSQRAMKGKPKSLQQQALRNIPLVGPKLQNTLVPSTRQKAIRRRLQKEKEARSGK